MRLIDGDELLSIVRHMTVVDKSVMHRMLIQMPTVDAVPVVHGRWIRVYSRPGVFKYLGWTCDQCDQRAGNEYAPQWYKFCPNCGARMDGKGNGNETD